nr:MULTISPECIES: hypothetical protein [Vibrio harveyi group]
MYSRWKHFEKTTVILATATASVITKISIGKNNNVALMRAINDNDVAAIQVHSLV